MYSEQQAAQHTLENNIGFTTPRQTVSSTIDLNNQWRELLIVNIYSFIMCFFYAVGVCSFLKYFYPNYKHQISTYISNHKELVGGLTVTTVLSVATEILTRIINSAVWSASIDSSLGALVAVLLPQGYIFFMGTCVNICCHIVYLKKSTVSASNSKDTTIIANQVNKSNEAIEITLLARDSEETRNLINDSDRSTIQGRQCFNSFIGCCDTKIVTKFSNNLNIHIILPLTLTAYGIIYTAFPTLVLMVPYPTQVIMIVPTAIAMLFATIIFFSIMFKLLNYKLSKLHTRPEKIKKTIKFIVCLFIPFYIVVLLLKSVAVIFVYLLIIARGSIGTGLLLTLILSILPTTLIAGISWIAKKTFLDKKQKLSDNQHLKRRRRRTI